MESKKAAAMQMNGLGQRGAGKGKPSTDIFGRPRTDSPRKVVPDWHAKKGEISSGA